jgi:hypothetical protein
MNPRTNTRVFLQSLQKCHFVAKPINSIKLSIYNEPKMSQKMGQKWH